MSNIDAFRITVFALLVAGAIALAVYLLASARDRDERHQTALKLLRVLLENALDIIGK